MAIDQYGQIIRRSPSPIPIQTNPNVSGGNYGSTWTTSYHSHEGIWNRFNDFIGGIGNWIAEASETIIGILVIVAALAIAIPFIVWIFSLGWFWGIVALIFLSGIVYYTAVIAIGILAVVGNIVLGIVRYIFYSGTTFLITCALIAGIYGYNYYTDHRSASVATEPLEEELATDFYVCTARTSLTIRQSASRNSEAIGRINRGDTVEVMGTENGFAQVRTGYATGYACLNYLRKIEKEVSENP